MSVLASFTPYRLKTIVFKPVWDHVGGECNARIEVGKEFDRYEYVAVNPEAFLEALPFSMKDGSGGATPTVKMSFAMGPMVSRFYVPPREAKEFLGFDINGSDRFENRR